MLLWVGCVLFTMSTISGWTYRCYSSRCYATLYNPCGMNPISHSSISTLCYSTNIKQRIDDSGNTNTNNIVRDDALIPTNDFYQYVQRKLRPKHVGIPRKRMDQQFAIQLMRNSYNVVDELNFVAMDEFQKDFFLFRQNEWEDYRSFHPNVIQGDLADPLYFDFISFCQYAVIANKMRNGRIDFIEKVGAAGENQVVKLDPRYLNNGALPEAHSSLVGDKLLDFILDKYPTITPSTVLSKNYTLPLTSTSHKDFQTYAQSILDIFTINLYDLNARITALPASTPPIPSSVSLLSSLLVSSQSQSSQQPPISSSSTSTSTPTLASMYQVEVTAPANLWSLQALLQRNDEPTNDFEIKVLRCLADRCKLKLDVLSTDVINQISISYLIRIT